jgi:hypothetical protein
VRNQPPSASVLLTMNPIQRPENPILTTQIWSYHALLLDDSSSTFLTHAKRASNVATFPHIVLVAALGRSVVRAVSAGGAVSALSGVTCPFRS